MLNCLTLVILTKVEFSRQILIKIPNKNFMDIRPTEAVILFHTSKYFPNISSLFSQDQSVYDTARSQSDAKVAPDSGATAML
jgi:hypothetical protein